MSRIYLALGSNMGNRDSNLNKAVSALISTGIKLNTSSFIYETEPWGNKEQPDYYNRVIEVSADIAPVVLLNRIHDIEKSMGRRTSIRRYTKRPIDIDILFYDDLIYTSEQLMIPHPLIHMRRFVLVPLADIAPEFRHPVLGKTITQLLRKCDDQNRVIRIL